MSQIEQDLRALRVEWIVARGVLALGVVASAAVFIWLGLHRAPVFEGTEAVNASVAPGSEGAQGAADAQNQAQQFCSSTIAVARSFGILPSGATPNNSPQKTDVQGRYVCLAQNGSVHYTISVDLMCRDLGDQRCFNIFNVTQDDGSVLFQRQS
jgi:hypothetical protein